MKSEIWSGKWAEHVHQAVYGFQQIRLFRLGCFSQKLAPIENLQCYQFCVSTGFCSSSFVSKINRLSPELPRNPIWRYKSSIEQKIPVVGSGSDLWVLLGQKYEAHSLFCSPLTPWQRLPCPWSPSLTKILEDNRNRTTFPWGSQKS